MWYRSLGPALLLLATAATLPARAGDDPAAYCAPLRSIEAESNTVRGRQVDPMTVFLGMTVNCDRKAVDYGQLVLAPASDLRKGWRDRLEKNWSAAYCKKGSVTEKAIKSGWSIASTVKTKDGSTYRVDAQCFDAIAALPPPPRREG